MPMLRNFPFFPQHDAMDCGPACLRMVAQHYGRHYTLESLLRVRVHALKEQKQENPFPVQTLSNTTCRL